MADRLTVTPDERKRFTTGENPSPPKYTYYALNNAVSYSKANHRPTVGDLNDIYNDFRKESPDGDFEDFRNYYFREHNGRRRIEEATEKAYSKFLIIREAIEQIDRDDMREFIEGIVLHGTYSGQSAREAVVEKVVRSLSDCERLDPNEGPDECQIQFGGSVEILLFH